eukprot:3910526-Rhodomonas_salina.3
MRMRTFSVLRPSLACLLFSCARRARSSSHPISSAQPSCPECAVKSRNLLRALHHTCTACSRCRHARTSRKRTMVSGRGMLRICDGVRGRAAGHQVQGGPEAPEGEGEEAEGDGDEGGGEGRESARRHPQAAQSHQGGACARSARAEAGSAIA